MRVVANPSHTQCEAILEASSARASAMATTVKERILESLAALPENATIEDAMERLYFLAKIERGQADADAGRVIPHDEVEKRFAR